MLNILYFSQQHRNTSIPNWKGIKGTFCAVLYNALRTEGFSCPERIKLSFDNKEGKLVVKTKGKQRTFRAKEWNACDMVKKIKQIK